MKNQKSFRFDTVKFPKVKKTKDGYLQGEVVASRAGVFEYLNLDGSVRRELRHPDDIFKKESLDTLKMIPVTANHPPEFVDSSNAAKYQVGYTGERYDIIDDKIITSITVTHKDVIEQILSGNLAELSYGYEVELIKEEGVYKGEKYDYRQLNPVYNHLAAVPQGRAGHDARFRFDNAAQLKEVFEINNQNEVSMSNDKAETKNDSGELQLRLDAITAEKSLLENKLITLETKLDHVEKAWATTKKELEAEKAIRTDDLIRKAVIERVALFAQAMPFLKNDSFGYLAHTDREIMEAAMNANRTDAIDFTGKSDEYIKGMFETFVGTSLKVSNVDTKGVFGVLQQNCDVSINNSMRDGIFKQLKEKKVS